MPSRWEIIVPGLRADVVRLEYLHAVVSTWFDDLSSHHASVKPYTVSSAIAADDSFRFQVSLLDDALIPRLNEQAAAGCRQRFGSVWVTLVTEPRQVSAASWGVLASAEAGRAWCLRFATPTTFRRGNRFSPTPCLRAILGSLRQSWADHAPAEIGPVVVDLAADPVWLTDIDVASHVTAIKHRNSNGQQTAITVSGFTGRLRFTSEPDPGITAAIDRLTALATYSGVGAYTTRGFGMTSLEPMWTRAPRP